MEQNKKQNINILVEADPRCKAEGRLYCKGCEYLVIAKGKIGGNPFPDIYCTRKDSAKEVDPKVWEQQPEEALLTDEELEVLGEEPKSLNRE